MRWFAPVLVLVSCRPPVPTPAIAPTATTRSPSPDGLRSLDSDANAVDAPGNATVGDSDRAPGAATPDADRRSALDEVARIAARSASDGYIVSAHALREAMATRLGSGMWPYVVTAWGTDAEIAVQLDARVAELRANADVAELGVATATGRAGTVGVVIALPPPHLPIEVARGTATARIAMAWPWSAQPSVYAVTPTSAHRLADTTYGRDGARFELAVDCRRPAAIEIRAGDRVVASVVDACGAPVRTDALGANPSEARGGQEIDVGPPAQTRVELEARVFELLNRDRVLNGRAPLAWDGEAHAQAREHARDMARLGYIGHHAPDGADLRTRMARAALAYVAMRENVGHATGPAVVQDAFMHSPGHRINALADDVERVAIGVAFDRDDPSAFYVTQLFRK